MSWGDITNPYRRTPAVNCKDCNIELTEANRHFKDSLHTMPTHRCRNCWNKHQNEYSSARRKTNEKFAEGVHNSNRKWILKSKYGMTEEQYNEKLIVQGGVCAICKFPCVSGDKLSVDHCHKTGEIRGLLCKSCNIAIAAVDENEEIIYNMLDYIRQYNDRATIRPVGLKSEVS